MNTTIPNIVDLTEQQINLENWIGWANWWEGSLDMGSGITTAYLQPAKAMTKDHNERGPVFRLSLPSVIDTGEKSLERIANGRQAPKGKPASILCAGELVLRSDHCLFEHLVGNLADLEGNHPTDAKGDPDRYWGEHIRVIAQTVLGAMVPDIHAEIHMNFCMPFSLYTLENKERAIENLDGVYPCYVNETYRQLDIRVGSVVPEGFAAITRYGSPSGNNCAIDIGDRTTEIIFAKGFKLVSRDSDGKIYGVLQLIEAIQEELVNAYGRDLDVEENRILLKAYTAKVPLPRLKVPKGGDSSTAKPSKKSSLARRFTHTSTYNVSLTCSTGQQDVGGATPTAKQQPTPTSQPSTQSSIDASQALVRIAQANASQYARWWASVCSATSLTEVINAYGHQFRITDILKVESNQGAISPEEGLRYGNGIDQAASWFGFETSTLNTPSVDQVVDIANKGQPVIVSFPSQTWNGGHILVVRGGDKGTVKLADSSSYNLQSVTRAYFTTYWRGFAKILTPSKYTITNKPTATVATINKMLAAYHSPTSRQGQMIYDTTVTYGLDPAYIVATFAHESNFGTRGEATKSKSPGNLRCIQSARCEDGYAQFDDWQAGFEALCKLLASDLYVKDGRVVPETIIPRFAPAGDDNNENAYIHVLKHVMDVLRAADTSIERDQHRKREGRGIS